MNIKVVDYISKCVLQLCLTFCDPMDCSLLVSSAWDSPGKNTGVDCHALIQGGDLPDPGIESLSLGSPALAGGFFPTIATCEALGNTEMEPKRLLNVLSKDDGLLSCDNFQEDIISLIGDIFFINKSKIS